MKAYRIHDASGLDSLRLDDIAEPTPGPGEILVEMRAWSLNHRDLAMPHGGYYRNDKVKKAPPMIPLSDGAGTVVGVGPGVTRFQTGDRVAGCFFQDWDDGDVTEAQMFSALGGSVDGVLAERVVLRERGAVHLPESLGFEAAATLPCAAVTAWQALTSAGLKAGDNVLMLGTGGVSLFALQLAKAFGARAIITSSSDAKLERVRAMGADETLNYTKTPEWGAAVRKLTDGVGVDNVIEVGGPGTLEQSLKATRVSGAVSLIGLLTGPKGSTPPPSAVFFNRITLRGIYVGSRRMFESVLRAVTANDIEPVIDRTFAFEEAKAAYEYLQKGQHIGKVVLTR